jgi:predicted nucleotidyltransferase
MTDNHVVPLDELLKDIQPILDFYKKPDVSGIILYGGYGRGEQLPHSDVDLGVICKNEAVKKELQQKFGDNWEVKSHYVEPVYYDFEHLNSQPLPERFMRDYGFFWNEDTRFNWQQSKILYDPSGQIQQLIKDKANLPEREKQANLTVLIWVIGRSLNYHLPRYVDAQKFAEAQMLMNRLIGHIIHYVYNSHGLLMPYEGAAFYWFDKNGLTGKKTIEELLKNAEANKESCDERIEKLWQVCQELNINIELKSVKGYLEYFFETNGTKKWEN